MNFYFPKLLLVVFIRNASGWGDKLNNYSLIDVLFWLRGSTLGGKHVFFNKCPVEICFYICVLLSCVKWGVFLLFLPLSDLTSEPIQSSVREYFFSVQGLVLGSQIIIIILFTSYIQIKFVSFWGALLETQI